MEPNDHDLLQRMDVKLDRVIKDVADLNDSTARRVAALEQEKFDKAEAARLAKEYDVIHRGHDKRIRFLERGYWTAVGALTIIDVVIGYVLTILLRHIP